MIILIHNEHSKMVRKSRATIDGRLHGPDAICEWVAMHVQRLDAAKTVSVTLVADGAFQIWDRIVELAKLDATKVRQVLDNCHPTRHVSLALLATGCGSEDRKILYCLYRTHLRDDKWQQIIDELTEFRSVELDLLANESLRTEIANLRKYAEAGRLNYPHFAMIGIPVGSGAIESSVRRALNIRLKSNAMFRRAENAEAMLAIRASVISNRWDQQQSEIKQRTLRTAVVDWTWHPQQISNKKVKANEATATSSKKPTFSMSERRVRVPWQLVFIRHTPQKREGVSARC